MSFDQIPDAFRAQWGISPDRPANHLGTSFNDRPVMVPRELSEGELVSRMVDLVRERPEIGWRLGKLLGEAAFEAPLVEPMPMTSITSIEASFGDRGPSKAKRPRKDRAPARYDCTLQVCVVGDRGVSSPSWRGQCKFYEPDRTMISARELTKPTKCKTPFTPVYIEMIEQAVAFATANDMLLGFICTKSAADRNGHTYHDRQLMLVDRLEMESHALSRAIIFLGGDSRNLMIELPRSCKRTSKGKALNSAFVCQSRGVRRVDQFSVKWQTGLLQIHKQ